MSDTAALPPIGASPDVRLSSDEFFRRARERLTFDVPPGLTDRSILAPSGDQGTDEMLALVASERPIRPAAVLVGVVDHEEPTVILTQRTAHLKDHAGQVAFPGGKIDATDASPMDAALREAWEEIGLTRDFIEPVGYLDLYATGFGFRIVPTLARVKPGFILNVNVNEVDDVFEVPLAFLMDPINHQVHSRKFRDIDRTYYAMPFENRNVWGATAGMLRALYLKLVET